MKLNKLTVAISAASAMLIGVSQAQAFDTVDWDWHLDVKTDVDQYIDIDVDVGDLENPTGLGIIEIEQEFDGSLTSISKVNDIDNKSKSDIDVGFDWEGESTSINIPVLGEHTSFEGNANLNIDYTGPELGNLESAATAVANNASVTTNVMTNLDVDQDWDGSGSILASSFVNDIDNMTVDSVATAVANNLSVDLQPVDVTGDSVLLANIVQVGNGDISAYSTVNDVKLGSLAPNNFEGPEISSVATAVGNNVNVNLGNVSNGL